MEEELEVQLSWHAAADARSTSNGSIVSPAARRLSLRSALALLHLGEHARGGLPAYVRQSDLRQQPSLRTLEPISRVLEHAGGRLHKAGMWLGDSSMISTLHHDDYHNILVLLAGRKRVLLLPPSVKPRLDLRHYAEERWEYVASRGTLSSAPVRTGRTIDNFYHLDVFATEEEEGDDARDEVAPYGMLCELSAGEALYIPHPWAHAVLSANDEDDGFGLSLAVNVWWQTDRQYMLQAIWRLGCTAAAVVLFALSARGPKRPAPDAADGPGSRPGAAPTGRGNGSPTPRRGKKKKHRS